MFMFRRNHVLREKINGYLATAGETLDAFGIALTRYLTSGPDDVFASLVADTHAMESEADNIRREIEIELFEKSLLPESREDILLMLERLDLIPNKAEEVLRDLFVQNIHLPVALHDDIRQLAMVAMDCGKWVIEATGKALDAGDGVSEISELIDREESMGDEIEEGIIAELFRGDLPIAEKILHRDIIVSIGSLCDLADDMAGLLTIFRVKRGI